MKLTATKFLKRYGGKTVAAGEVFECKPRDAVILKAIKHAVDYVEPPPRKVAAVFKPIPVIEETVVRRDLEASEEDEPKKRAYKRRDMTAE